MEVLITLLFFPYKVEEVKKQHEKAIADLHEKYKDEIVEVESKHSQHIDGKSKTVLKWEKTDKT